MVEAFAHIPGAARRFGLGLEVTPGHVEAGGVAPDQARSGLRRHVRTA